MPDDIIAAILARMEPIQLLRIAPMPECEQLSSLSEDTLAREHADKIVHLSTRRKGMRVIHALLLGEAERSNT